MFLDLVCRISCALTTLLIGLADPRGSLLRLVVYFYPSFHTFDVLKKCIMCFAGLDSFSFTSSLVSVSCLLLPIFLYLFPLVDHIPSDMSFYGYAMMTKTYSSILD